MRHIIFIIVFISYLFSSVNEDKNIFTNEELEWINNNPIIKVGVDEDWPPFDYLNSDKKHSGICSEYLNIISNKTGLKFDIYASNWSEVIHKIKNKELDMLACDGKTSDREALLNFTSPYLSLDVVVVGKKELKINSFEQIKDYKVAVQNGDYLYDALKKKFPDIKVVFTESNSEALKLVSYGKADLYIDNLPTISYFIEKNLLTNLEIKIKSDFEPSEISVAVIKEKDILKNIIQKVLNDISDNEKKEIQKKWAFSIDEKNSINLTEEELLWIKNNPIIKIGADANWPPFEYVDSSGNYQGIASEYLNLITKYTGLQFEVNADNWYNTISKTKNKELDMLACVAKTADREEYLDFTLPFLSIDVVVIAKKELQIKNFDEIKNYKIAVQKGNFVYENLIKKYPNIEFIFATSNKEAFELVSYGKADVFIGNMPVFSYFVEKEMLTNLEIKFKADFEKIDLSMAVLKGKETLFNIIQKVMPKIVEKEQEKINKKWIFELKEKSKEINFTKEEIEWIKKNPIIKISGDPSWPPYSFYDEEGKHIGIIPDLLNEVFKDSNIKVEYVKTNSWSETLDLIKKDKIDLIDSIAYTPLRDEYLDFSNKYIGAEIVIIANNKETNYINSFNTITDKNIATVKDYSVIEEIKRDFPEIKNIKEYDSPLDGLRDLSNSRIDYFIMDIPSFEFYSKKYSLSNLKIAGPSGYSYKCGFGVKENSEELVSILNKLLNNVASSKKDEVYRKWIQIKYEQKIDYDLVWKVIGFAFFIIAGTIYWNRKLKEQIREKEKIQKELQNNKDFINAIMDSQVNMVITTNGEEIKQANKAFFDFFDYENLEQFKKDFNCICDLFDNSNPQKYLLAKENDSLWIDKILANPEESFKVLIYKNSIPYIFGVTASYITKDSNLKTAVFTDITQLENLNDILLKAKESAENIAKQKSEFLANMSHEIRTPMNSVIGFTEILDKEIKDPIHKEYLNSIKKGGNALLRIINDILDLSKIEAGKLDIKNESLNPTNLFLEIESIFHSKIISKNIAFMVEIDKTIPKYIIIDGVRIRQILFNLIGNAIKFTEKGQIKLKVENVYKDNIKSKVDLIFSVEDSGIGIDEKNLNNIFNAFEQQSNHDVAKYGGTGLGLAICTKLVHMMNGEISVKSQRNKGSIFTVILKDIPVSSMEDEIVSQKLLSTNIIFEKAQILVVDDVEENRKLVLASLKDFDINLIMAQNGQEALDKLKNVNVDLILMDLRMPVMNGYEAASIIKNDERLKKIPLIALTASVMGKDLEKVSKYGFDGYLRKPVILDDLLVELGKYLEYHFLNEEISLNNDLKIINPDRLNFVIIELENRYKQEWINIKDGGDFSLIEEFANKLNTLSIEQDIYILKDYSEELIKNINSFDIEKVDYLMNTYLELIENLKGKLEN